MSATSKEEIKPTILIADDDLSTRMLLRAAISQWNYPVIEACDGEEAWELLQASSSPQIATVDWMMPKIDGVDLCRRAKQLAKPPYMILLTSMHGSANIVNALEAGADDFLTKPFNYVELRSRLHVGQRIINFTNKLEAIIEAKKINNTLDISELPLITEKISDINNQIYKKWAMLQNHIHHIGDLQLEDQCALKNMAHDLHLDQQQLTEEIKILVSFIEEQRLKLLNSSKDPIKKKSNTPRKKK